MEKQQKKFRLIEEALLDSILNYLDERPHKEVRGLVDGIIKCPPVDVKIVEHEESPEAKGVDITSVQDSNEGKTRQLKPENNGK